MSMSMENKVSAGFFVRLVAYGIDSIIAALVVVTIKLPLNIAAGSVDFLNANFLFHYTIIDVIAYLGVATYFVLLTYFAHTTPGKMLFRLEVITEDGSWSFVNILYRETIGRFLSSLLCIGYFAILVTKNHQGFHDMLCNTCVVYKNMQKAVNPVMARPVAQQVKPVVLEQPRPQMQPVGITQNTFAENPAEKQPIVKPENPVVKQPVVAPVNPVVTEQLQQPQQPQQSQQPQQPQQPQRNSNAPTYH